jgi:hypothetical protein
MLYLLDFSFLLINIDQETVLNWFGWKIVQIKKLVKQRVTVMLLTFLEPSTDVSLNTLRLIVEGLWDKIQDGLTLADIENVLFFIVFVRFVILALRYNLKLLSILHVTFAGYLWYKHLIDLISMYRSIIKTSILHKLGMDGSIAFSSSTNGFN